MGISSLPRRRQRRARPRPRRGLHLERLEERAVPSTIRWVCDNGDWSTPSCWEPARLPAAGDDVVIDRPGTITVTHSQGSTVVQSVTSQEGLTLQGGTLRMTAASSLNGPVLLSGGTLAGNSDVTVNGYLTWATGDIGAAGSTVRVRALGGLEILDGGSRRMHGGTLENHHVAYWRGSVFAANPGASSEFVNMPGAFLGAEGNLSFNGFSGRFRNEGYFTSTGSVGCAGQVFFTNTGYLEVLSGTFSAGCLSVSANGLHFVAAGATLRLEGATTGIGPQAYVWGGGSLAVSADMAFVSGIIQVGGDLTLGPSFAINVASPYIEVGGRLITRPSGQNNLRAAQVRAGSLRLEGGSLNLLEGSALLADGEITTLGGVLTVSADSAVYTPNAVRLQSGGATLTGGVLLADQGIHVMGGTLSGRGAVGMALYNTSGHVRPGGTGTSTGQLMVVGDYVQAAAATLHAKLGGVAPGTFDQLLMTGRATLAGTLNVTALSGYVPNVGDEFRIVRSANLGGEFSQVNLPMLPGRFLELEYQAQDVNLITMASAGPDGGGPAFAQPGSDPGEAVAAALAYYEVQKKSRLR